MSTLRNFDPAIADAIESEKRRIEETIDLIASENYTLPEVMEATGSVMTNKYAEGLPGQRYYSGCEHVDSVENLARERVKKLFGAEHANVQPHAGAQANMCAFHALLNPGDTILGMSLADGGHLTHGYKINFSGRIYNAVNYGVDPETGLLDYEAIRELAHKHKPKLIIAGATAYSRTIDFKKFKEIADEVGAKLMADIAHISGLIAADLHPSPVPYADVVTSTTHKVLRGPRGGFILCKKEWATQIDKAVMPGIQGGPQMHHIAAKAVGFKYNLSQEFKTYAQQVIKNSKAMVGELKKRGYKIVSETTDNHLFVVDLRSKGMKGNVAERALEKAGIILNKNCVPQDPESPLVTSGVRIGTPAITSRGFKEEEAIEVASLIDLVLTNTTDEACIKQAAARVKELCLTFPVYNKAASYTVPETSTSCAEL